LVYHRFFWWWASFSVSIYRKKECKTGWNIVLFFQIGLHSKDLPLLYKIKDFFGIGNIRIESSKEVARYSVTSIKDLNNVIIPHFDKYFLLTQKRADFELFKLVVKLINNGEHLTIEGIRKIIAIKAYMNLGLSSSLKQAFPDTIPVARPIIEVNKYINPAWFSGFTEAEWCFGVDISKSQKLKTGHAVNLRFTLTQHLRDRLLLDSFCEHLGCGNIKVGIKNGNYFYVTKFEDIVKILIPLFNKYPLQGAKLLDYTDFLTIIELMKNKAHLTKEGLDKIREIKAGMNTGRDHSSG
jgi:hypothetical protein